METWRHGEKGVKDPRVNKNVTYKRNTNIITRNQVKLK